MTECSHATGQHDEECDLVVGLTRERDEERQRAEKAEAMLAEQRAETSLAWGQASLFGDQRDALKAEVARLNTANAEMKESLEMSCVAPADHRDCPGCQYAEACALLNKSEEKP